MNLVDQQNLKIKLEGRFRNEVRRLFNTIRSEYRIGISTGLFIRAERYRPQVITMLEVQYKRVQEAFRGVVTTDTKAEEDDETRERNKMMGVIVVSVPSIILHHRRMYCRFNSCPS